MDAHDSETPTGHGSAWRVLTDRLVVALKPYAAPVAISFVPDGRPAAVGRLNDPHPAPNEHGRTGQVPAGCVFWVRGSQTSFATDAADHANCSVGSLTHGFLTVEEAAIKDDVGAVLDSGWVDEAAVRALPTVAARPGHVVYGPLADSLADPDVVLLRINGLAMMALRDALPDLRIEGKPQCHIIAIAKEQGVPAASVGCALSRSRTGMKSEEMTCALPARRLDEIVTALESTITLNRAMASYASADAKRFQL